MSVRTLVLLTTCCLALTLSPNAAAQDNPVVVIETSMGTITAELDRAKAPLSVENFLQYVEDDYYHGTVFHRVIKGFMIQGGGFTADMRPKPTRASITNEATNGLRHDRGTLAMARNQDVVDSATSQFFISVVDNTALNNRGTSQDGYYGDAVFGKLTGGMDVLDKIEDVATGSRGPFQNVPDTPVEILSITVQP